MKLLTFFVTIINNFTEMAVRRKLLIDVALVNTINNLNIKYSCSLASSKYFCKLESWNWSSINQIERNRWLINTATAVSPVSSFEISWSSMCGKIILLIVNNLNILPRLNYSKLEIRCNLRHISSVSKWVMKWNFP